MAAGTGTYLTGTKLVEVDAEGIVVETAEGKRHIDCDTVLLAGLGSRRLQGEALRYRRVIPVGDSSKCPTSWPQRPRPMRP